MFDLNVTCTRYSQIPAGKGKQWKAWFKNSGKGYVISLYICNNIYTKSSGLYVCIEYIVYDVSIFDIKMYGLDGKEIKMLCWFISLLETSKWWVCVLITMYVCTYMYSGIQYSVCSIILANLPKS